MRELMGMIANGFGKNRQMIHFEHKENLNFCLAKVFCQTACPTLDSFPLAVPPSANRSKHTAGLRPVIRASCLVFH
jgi:hypothetical protein